MKQNNFLNGTIGLALAALAGIMVMGFVSGCAVGPDYKRPAVNTPANFRFADGLSTNSFADLRWWQVFQDPVLDNLIALALTNNYDLKAAVARVEEARNQAAGANAAFLPQVNYGGNVGRGRNGLYNSPVNLNGQTASSAGVNLNATWELDLWGRIRRSSEAARAQFLATDQARRGVTITLISQVATTYFQLLQFDEELVIQRLATNAYTESYQLFNARKLGGTASELDTDSAEAALANAKAVIPQLELQIATAENQLAVLLGRPPGSIARSALSNQPPFAAEIPIGLPSDLLRRRPDVASAEDNLIAANANIGVSVANFFPKLGLTTFLGHASPELSSFTGGAGNAWDVGATLAGPLFQGGLLRAQYRQSKAKFEEAKATYHQTVLTALQDVSNALITRQKLGEVFTNEAQAAIALTAATDLSLQRYVNGRASYYEVLQAEQQLYPTLRAKVQAQVGEMTAVVQLYKALGGGWTPETKRTYANRN